MAIDGGNGILDLVIRYFLERSLVVVWSKREVELFGRF